MMMEYKIPMARRQKTAITFKPACDGSSLHLLFGQELQRNRICTAASADFFSLFFCYFGKGQLIHFYSRYGQACAAFRIKICH
jgi:hypothetical protein